VGLLKMINASSNSEVIQRLLKAADMVVLTSACFVISLRNLTTFDATVPAMLAFTALTVAFLVIFLLRGLRQYDLQNLAAPHRTILTAIFISCLAGLSFFILSQQLRILLAPMWVLSWFSFMAVYFGASRLAAKAWIGPKISFRQRIAIVGGGKAAEDAIITLEKSKNLDIEIVGLFDDRFDNRSPESVRKHKKIGKISDLADYARAHTVDLIIVAIPMSAEQRMLQILKRLWELPVDIRVSGQAAALKLSPRAYTYLGDLPLLALFDRPLNGWSQFMKDTMDRAIALVAIVLLAPVMLAVAVAVRYESKGPIIFKQKRFGFNNELIEVFKFRSMYTDMADAAATKLVTKNDPRVTRVGRIIRKTSLDELPQLFNVLTGQLSLVGPRPHATQAKAAGELYDEVIDGYFARHKVKPGITGWAQINGWRGETDTHEKIEQRVKHDLDYIDRWSLMLDLYIIARTPLALLKSENAY
jgi:Undecaprenyl-phosphate glucose phosphotransferase